MNLQCLVKLSLTLDFTSQGVTVTPAEEQHPGAGYRLRRAGVGREEQHQHGPGQRGLQELGRVCESGSGREEARRVCRQAYAKEPEDTLAQGAAGGPKRRNGRLVSL